MMEPMTKEEAESFLKWNPKPWSYDHNHEYYKEPTIVCKDKVRIRLKELLRYIAYLEQDRERLQKDSRVLAALQDAGVDNWPPYDDIAGDEN